MKLISIPSDFVVKTEANPGCEISKGQQEAKELAATLKCLVQFKHNDRYFLFDRNGGMCELLSKQL